MSTITSTAAGASSATTTAGAAKTATGAGGKLTATFDTFLKLLVTQLKNQDPMAPQGPEEFTKQLVQFSSVEQQIAQNSKLDRLVELQTGTGDSTALGYIGLEVDVSAETLTHTGGAATLSYRTTAPTKTDRIEIVGADGQVVRTIERDGGSGVRSLNWDGKDEAGKNAGPGTYKMRVTSTGADGAAVDARAVRSGVVSGVEMIAGTAHVILNGKAVPASAVIAARQADREATA